MLNTDPLAPARRRVLDIIAANHPAIRLDGDVIVLDEDGIRSFLPLAAAVAAEHACPCVFGDDPSEWSGWLFGDDVAWLDAVPVEDDEPLDDDEPWQCDGCGARVTGVPGRVWSGSDETLLLCRTCTA